VTLIDFIEQYDLEGPVVLLEGKRGVAPKDGFLLTELGRMLASQTRHITFRRGNASGSDELFSSWVTAVDPRRMQVVTPYSGHRSKANQSQLTFSLDETDLAAEPDIVYQSKTGGRNYKLIDRFAGGNRDRVSIKAAYLVHDSIKVIGSSSAIPPASFSIFFDNLAEPCTGGTGHSMTICTNNQVPYIDQSVWMQWLDTPPTGS